MCRKVIAVCLVCVCVLSSRSIALQYAYRIDFTDKNNTPFSLSSPAAYLSTRALARRSVQGISIDSSDLPVNPAYIDSVLTLTGGILHESSRWLNLCVILVTDSTQIHALDGKPFIKSKQYIAYYGSDLHHKPTGSLTTSGGKTTNDEGYYGNTSAQTNMVKGYHLHDLGYNGEGKLIAVLDAGFINTDTHAGFDNLRTTGRILDVHNFTLASANIYCCDTHGTEVLSTIAGYVPGTYVGAAPLAYYALYVTEDGNSEQPTELMNMLCAAERADSLGADVITTSLGYNTFDDHSFDFNFTTDFTGVKTVAAQAANIATKKGMLFVATAGNEGVTPWHMVLTPGDADSALTIGSVDGTGAPYISSGYGPNAASRIKPDVCGLGHLASVFIAGGYGQLDGTSLSTPQIAGWATCLMQANPAATPYQIRQAIIMCASSYSSPGVQLGYGIPDFQCTEHILNVKETPSPLNGGRWISVAPNPFDHEITISAAPSENGNVTFTITDMTGKTLMSFSRFLASVYNQPFAVEMPSLPAGIYVLKASTATQQAVMKLVK